MEMLQRQDHQAKARKQEYKRFKDETHEKHKMHLRDAEENRKRIQTLKHIRAYKILEKHALKEGKIKDYNVTTETMSRNLK